MALLQVTPKEGSYVVEWVALQFDSTEGFSAVKRLMKNSPWEVRVMLDGPEGLAVVVTQMHHTGIESWTVNHGDWIVKAPSGRFFFMGEEEFQSQFTMASSE